MRNHRRLTTKKLLGTGLAAVAMLTLTSLYLTVKCFASNSGFNDVLSGQGHGHWCQHVRVAAAEEAVSIKLKLELFEKGPKIKSLLEEKNKTEQTMKSYRVQDQDQSDQFMTDAFLLKYKELKESHLFATYPIQKSCNSEKRAAVPCNDTDCEERLTTGETGLKSLMTSTHDARKNLHNPLEQITAHLPFSHLTIVTAASANHFLESQAMIRTLHENVFPRFHNISFYFYDMGLEKSQVEQLKKHCQCQVIQFPFEQLPASISAIKCYTWKPLIVHAHIKRTNILIWADASVRFNTTRHDDLFTNVTKKGLLVSLSERYIRPVAHHAASRTFQYFQVEPCSVANFQEIEASFMAFHNEVFTRDIIVENWAACALDPDCMCPNGSLSMHHCDGGLRKYAKCHRFDQSAMSLIILKLFGHSYSTFFFDHSYYEVKRGVKDKYFIFLESEQQKFQINSHNESNSSLNAHIKL